MSAVKDGFVHPEFLVETEWLAAHLGDPGLVVLDCTAHLIPDPKTAYTVESGRQDFENGHIPGAQFVDLQADLSDNSGCYGKLRFMLPNAVDFAAAMGRFGVCEGIRVILCTQHDDAAMGSAGAVVAAQLRLRHRCGAERRLQEMEPRGASSRNRTGAATADREIRRARRPQADGRQGGGSRRDRRSNDLYDQRANIGTICRTGGNTYGRAGRIEGSVNVPVASLLDPETCAFLPAPDLRAKYVAVGAFDKPRAITYCGGGIAASADALVLVMLGHPDVRLYDASMEEWGNDPRPADGVRVVTAFIASRAEEVNRIRRWQIANGGSPPGCVETA